MTSKQATTDEWRVEATEGLAERPQAIVAGPGHRFILHTQADASELAELLNAQTAALAEAALLARRHDCRKSNLQKAAMVPCLNLPRADECYVCQLTKARFERNSFCICDDDDELPTGPADYCPVHGNTYRYVLAQETRLVDVVRARDAAKDRVHALETALREIAALPGEAGELARGYLTP